MAHPWAQRYIDNMNKQIREATTPNEDPDGLRPDIEGPCTLLHGEITPVPQIDAARGAVEAVAKK